MEENRKDTIQLVLQLVGKDSDPIQIGIWKIKKNGFIFNSKFYQIYYTCIVVFVYVYCLFLISLIHGGSIIFLILYSVCKYPKSELFLGKNV